MIKTESITCNSSLRGAIPTTYVHLLFEYLQSLDINAVEVLGESPPDDDYRGLRRYSVQHWSRLLNTAARYLLDPQLGLHLGQTITPAHLGVMGYVLMASPNVAAALRRMEQYHRLLYDVNPMSYTIMEDYIELRWNTQNGMPGSYVDECAVTAMVQFTRHITGQVLTPNKVCFVNAKPANTEPYYQFFGCPVHFDQDETVVQFRVATLSISLCHPDQALVRILEQQALALLTELSDTDDFEELVRRSIASTAHYGDISLERVANELNISSRTLRRRLEARGKTFRKVRDNTLRLMAESYLANPHLTLSEIALLLGYSEQSAFQRAFQHWVGEPPGIWRKRLLKV